MSNIALETIALTLSAELEHNRNAFMREGKTPEDHFQVFVRIDRGTLKNWIAAISEAAK